MIKSTMDFLEIATNHVILYNDNHWHSPEIAFKQVPGCHVAHPPSLAPADSPGGPSWCCWSHQQGSAVRWPRWEPEGDRYIQGKRTIEIWLDHQKKNLKHHFLSPLLFPFLRNLGKTFYHFFLPLSPFTHILPKNNATDMVLLSVLPGPQTSTSSTPDEMGAAAARAVCQAVMGKDHSEELGHGIIRPLSGQTICLSSDFFYQTQPWGNQRSHGETLPGQQEANVISELVFLMFLVVSFGGSKSKIEQNNTQFCIIW